jgi:GTP-binding protein
LPQLFIAPAVFISAEQHENFAALEDKLAKVAANRVPDIATGPLNRVLNKALEDTPPPVVSTAPLKLYYASLAGIRPPRVKLFVNKVEAAADNYLQFLKKRLRENFDLDGIPLTLEVVERPKKIASIRSEEKGKSKRSSGNRRK